MNKIKLEIANRIKQIPNKEGGMSYVELIVVLSIFAIISSIVIFNYGDFQARVDIKNLATDIALQIVEAQKSAVSGLLPTQSPTVSPWKPSYGVYFTNTDYKSFIYFTDLNDNTFYDGPNCTGECLNKVSITKNNTISSINVFYSGDPTAYVLSDLTITFIRPGSGATIKSTTSLSPNISYVQINIVSPKGAASTIKLYPSGRVQVN